MTEHAIEAAADSELAAVLFQQSGDGLFVSDALTGQIRDANPAAERMTGFSREELLAVSLRSLLRHEQPWHDWSPAAAKEAARVHEGFMLRTRRADDWIPVRVEMTPVPPDGGRARLLIRLGDGRADLALRRRAERAEGELRRVLANASECHWSAVVTPGGWAYRNVSPAVQRLTGRPADAFLGSPAAWADAVLPEDRPAWRAFRDRLAQGQSGSLDYRFLHADGRAIRVRESVAVVPESDGLVLEGVLGEAAGPAAGAPPASSGVAKSDRMLGTISHDFNNLIAGILGNVSLAGIDPSPASVAASLGRIESIANRAADLCRQLSACAGHVSRGGTTPDPAGVVRRVAEELAASHPAVAVSVVVDGGLPPLDVGPAAVGHAVEELVRNALQAGATRVAVRLGCAPPEPSFPEVFAPPSAGPPSPGVHLQVRDDGEGISEAARGKLGEPFFTTRPGQRGLGVASVLGVVRACGCDFRLYSREGAGTAALLSFPAARPPAPPAPAPDAAKAPLVLLVDDEQSIVDIASRLLVSAGCRVLTARDGPGALDEYKRHAAEIRLVILDLELPRLGGEKVVAEIRRLDAQVPIVLMSGHHDLEDRPEVAALRLSGCLRKPFRLPEMLALLERVLGRPAKG